MQLNQSRSSLQQELEDATDFIIHLEEKVYKANKTALEVMKQMKDAKLEIKLLQDQIKGLNKKEKVDNGSYYVPCRVDLLDQKLAEYINSYSDLKVKFVKEQEGVYLFGSKRIYVKTDKNQIMVRVGGGYLAIDEFIRQYHDLEIEKQARQSTKDSMVRSYTLSDTIFSPKSL